MNNIIEPSKNFDFSKLSLAHPSGIQGGAYFTKILYNSKPLYIQTTKSLTRQGFVKSGKKYYCDLMLDNNSETLIHWFENLEETCQNLIFEKSEAWFQNSLDKNDVETAFNPVIRIYRSGKYYLVRTNIKVGVNNEPYIKLYDENEVPLSMNDIKEDTNIISILEIQGIKFTSRNFQIEIELRQVMVLDNEPLFDNCLIKTTFNSKNTLINQNENMKSLEESERKYHEPLENNVVIRNSDKTIIDNTNSSKTNILEIDTLVDLPNINDIVIDNIDHNTTLINGQNSEDILQEDDIEELNEINDLKETDELKEIDISVNLEDSLENNGDETLQLKKPSQVYYDLYKEARERAKAAKKIAIIAYLEAKNIKKTYMIDNLDESESDIDAEIEEVSESELDDL
jgi:hypothetical protein